MVVFLFTTICALAQEQPQVDIGGAVRFNYNYSTWKQGQKNRGGDFGYDIFRINTKAAYKGIDLDAEYRVMTISAGGGVLKHGIMGYALNKKDKIQLGLLPIPFGNTPANSSSFFMSMNFFLGLEDSYNMGANYRHIGDKIDFSFAFFKNPLVQDYGNNSDLSPKRYGYDVGSIDVDGDGKMSFRNKKINQINGKVDYKFGDDNLKVKLGLSAQYGGLYNLETEKTGDHYATAVQGMMDWGKLGLKAQYTMYKYNTKAPATESKDMVAMVGFGGAYLIAAEADTYTFGLSYTVPVNWKPISQLCFYNDYAFMNKKVSGFKSSQMNVTGLSFSAGPILTYIDFAAGKSQSNFGYESIYALSNGTGQDKWQTRFNINIGYYF
ncbi:hypothetical protein ACL9RF_04410 [Sphingobacterium sp. Mn56C]|uniref:hypothetical protein n=1 Tax=Sphingobacterium sp. Mn56C TaxID=3395261 RepID=UPI003BE6FAC0